MARIDSFLRLVVEQGASDLHLGAGAPPTVRLNGELVPLPFRALSDLEARRLILEILSDAQREAVERDKDLDVVYDVQDKGRFRGNVFFHKHGIGSVFRVIPRGIPTLEELGLPAAVRNFTRLANGLVLVTGPTGSGKTTTLAAIIDEINRSYQRHIITIEDPIEFLHRDKKSIVNQREVEVDTRSFAAALRSALRQDPDVILVGEMRDLETIEAALRVSETGHLCFATLHTNSAVQTINRVIDVFPSHQQAQVRTQLSFVLEGVVCQTLLPKANGPGRALCVEVMVPTPAIRNLIREDKIHQIYSQMQIGQDKFGMQTLNQCLADLYGRRLISHEDAVMRSSDPDELQNIISSGNAGLRSRQKAS